MVEILQTDFTSCIMKKHYFLMWTKRNSVFSLFLLLNYFLQRLVIWLGFYFKCYLSIFIFLNFYIFLEVKCQAYRLTGVLSFIDVFEDFGHIFPTCFLQDFS